MTLRGRAALGNRANVALPTIELEGATVREALLVWKDVEISQGETGKKLPSQKKAKDKIALLANEAWSRDLSAWHGAAAERLLKASLPKTQARANLSVIGLGATERALDRRPLAAPGVVLAALSRRPRTFASNFPFPVKHWSAS